MMVKIAHAKWVSSSLFIENYVPDVLYVIVLWLKLGKTYQDDITFQELAIMAIH